MADTMKYRSGEKDNSAWKRPKYLHMLGINCRWSDIVVDEQPSLGTKEELEENAYGSEDPQVVRAGDRAPDAPGLVGADGTKTAFFDLFSPAKHTALLFVSDPQEAKNILACVKTLPAETFQVASILPQGSTNVGEFPSGSLTFVDEEGYGYVNYPPSRNGYPVVIVRPDGTVGAVVKGVEGVERYVKGVFIGSNGVEEK